MKGLLIEIYLNDKLKKSDLEFRQIIVGTIENRELGIVIDETSTQNMMEIAIEVKDNEGIKEKLENLLLSLGYTSFQVRDLFIY